MRVVAISVDPPETNRIHRARMGFTFPLLSDTHLEALRAYDLVHAGAAPDGSDIARPAEFLVDAAGVVRWRNLTGSIAVRLRPEEALRTIDALGPAAPARD